MSPEVCIFYQALVNPLAIYADGFKIKHCTISESCPLKHKQPQTTSWQRSKCLPYYCAFHFLSHFSKTVPQFIEQRKQWSCFLVVFLVSLPHWCFHQVPHIWSGALHLRSLAVLQQPVYQSKIHNVKTWNTISLKSGIVSQRLRWQSCDSLATFRSNLGAHLSTVAFSGL